LLEQDLIVQDLLVDLPKEQGGLGNARQKLGEERGGLASLDPAASGGKAVGTSYCARSASKARVTSAGGAM